MRKIFELQTDLTSFTYPIVKIVISISIFVLMFFRDRFITITTIWGEVLSIAVCCVLGYFCILCIYLSIGEIFHTIGNLLKK